MEPWFEAPGVTVWHGDCIEVMRGMPDESVHAIVTDPPYGLANTSPSQVTETIGRWLAGERDYLPGGSGFMGKAWDAFVPPVAVWDECLRVLKPGGHLLAFAGSRTFDLMSLGVRLAGFESRDSIAWLYGSGFPKSLDVSKAIDRTRKEDAEPVERVRSWLDARRREAGMSLKSINGAMGLADNGGGQASTWMTNRTSKAVPSLEQWEQLRGLLGFGHEMDAEVRRLNDRKGTASDDFSRREVVGTAVRGTAGFSDEMVPRPWKAKIGEEYNLTAAATEEAKAWEGWGTALKPAFEPIVVARKPLAGAIAANVLAHGTGALNVAGCRVGSEVLEPVTRGVSKIGTFDGADGNVTGARVGRWPSNVVLDESQASALDEQTGILKSGMMRAGTQKAGKSAGILGEFKAQPSVNDTYGDAGGASRFFPTFRYEAKAPSSERPTVDGVSHPTVKPVALMRWLVRLVTPSGGTVLEPFAGSGTTLEAALAEGFDVIGIEREADYLPLIRARLSKPIDVALDLGDIA